MHQSNAGGTNCRPARETARRRRYPHRMHLDRTARRILGSLIEKRFSTPEQYPLTLNALVLACNQRSNREPFMDLEPFIVEGCLTQLRINGYLTVVERDTGRAVRYKERLADSLGLTEKEAAVLAELLLRGPQTEQELARRTERMRKLASPEEALQVLEGLASRKIVEHLPRRTGERIARWRHLLTPPDEHDADGPSASASSASDAPPSEQTTVVMPTLGASPASPPYAANPYEATTKPAPTASHADEIAALHARMADMARTIDDLKSEVRGLRAAWDEFRNSR